MISVMGICLPERLIASFNTAVMPPQQGTSILRQVNFLIGVVPKISVNFARYCVASSSLGQPISTFLPGRNFSWNPGVAKAVQSAATSRSASFRNGADVPMSLIWIGHCVSRTSLSFAAGAALIEEQDGQSRV
jgi:hypothetical protein